MNGDSNLGGVGDYFFIRIMLDIMTYVVLHVKHKSKDVVLRDRQQQECTDGMLLTSCSTLLHTQIQCFLVQNLTSNQDIIHLNDEYVNVTAT